MTTWLFWTFATASVVTALLVVAQRNALRGVLMLMALLASVGGLYVLLAAPFAAVAQVALLAVGLAATFLPVTLFLDLPDDVDERPVVGPGAGARRFGVMLSAALVMELAWAFQRLRAAELRGDVAWSGGEVFDVLWVLLTQHAAELLLAGLLLAVAAIGAFVLVRREIP